MSKTATRYEATPFVRGMAEEPMEIDGKVLPWGTSGGAHIKDEGMAKAIEQKYEGRVIVSPVQSPDAHDRGHKYFFGGWPEMPWKRKQEEKQEAPAAEAQDAEDDGESEQE